jgi:hypothetical protein
VYSGNVEIIAITDIFKEYLSVNFVFESQITPPSTVIFGKFVTEISFLMLFNGDLSSGNYVSLFPVEGKGT